MKLFLFFIFLFIASATNAKDISIYENPAQLVDQSTQAFKLERFRNQILLVVVGYTSCPNLCPMITGQLKLLENSLNQKKVSTDKVQILFISIDPTDKSENLLQYSKTHKLDLKRWTLAQINPTEKDQLIKKLGLSYDKSKTKDHLRHSFSLVVINPSGFIVKTYPSALNLEFDKVTADITAIPNNSK